MKGLALYNKIYFSCSLLWVLSSHVVSRDIIGTSPQRPVSHYRGLRTIFALVPSVDNCLDVAF